MDSYTNYYLETYRYGHIRIINICWYIHLNMFLSRWMQMGSLLRSINFVGHEKPVVAVLWSPDDKQVITCGENEVIKRWDVGSGQCVQTYGRVDVGSVSCGWLHDGSGIIGAMSDRRIYLWSLDGTEMEHEQEQRAQTLSDVAMTSDGKWIVSVGKEQHEISLFSRETRAERVIQLHEKEMITSFSLSRDNKYLLIDLVTQVDPTLGYRRWWTVLSFGIRWTQAYSVYYQVLLWWVWWRFHR